MIFSKYEHSVLGAAMMIRGALSGTGDPLLPSDIKHLAEWLTWRTGEGWEPSQPGWETFEEAIRSVALAAVGLALAELAEPAP